MTFKIVQTKNKDVTELSIVPSDWESGGKLFWPQKHVKNRSRLIRDDRSKPSPQWDTISCTVKRHNILTYKEAVNEIEIMEGHTDTDNDVNSNYPQQQIHIGQRSQEINFEALADMLQSTKNVPIANQIIPAISETSENFELPYQPTTAIQLCTSDINSQILANQALMLEKINNLFVIMNTVIENQKNIAHKVAVLSVQMDDNNSKMFEKMEQPVKVTLLKDATPEERESFCLNEIDSLKGMEDFELLLLDQDQRNKIKKRLSILCTASDGSCITCAYKLLDILLTRDFLCKCSWSGGSRGEQSKMALKDRKLFIKFFFEMIFSWDPSFTVDKMEKFFKIVLKNAKKRKSSKNLRASSKRIRKSVTQRLKDNQLNESNNENEDLPTNTVNENETGNAEHTDMEIYDFEQDDSELDLC